MGINYKDELKRRIIMSNKKIKNDDNRNKKKKGITFEYEQ